LDTYEETSNKFYTHATPTLYNAGTKCGNLASCFLLGTTDSIEGIFRTITQCAQISKYAGGIGIGVSNIRSNGSLVRGTNGYSSGIVPMLRVFNETARYIDQAGRRKGSFAIFWERWHADVFDFLDLKKNHGKEEMRARDLFYGMWISDIFMKRVEADADWSLFNPDDCKDLVDLYGDEFDIAYEEYEKSGIATRTIKARELFQKMIVSQIETGTPYVGYKDAVNKKTNHKNLGTIRNSNLCVAGHTRILTKNGYNQIGPLKDQEVEVWNGFEWSNVTIHQTGNQQKMVDVSLSNGSKITCTPYHKFYLHNKYTHKGTLADFHDSLEMRAVDLKIGDRLVKHNMPPHYKNRTAFVTVLSVDPVDELHDTFCFTEPKLHAGIFEGVLTGQCHEIMQYSRPDEISSCTLASIALPMFVTGDDFNFNRLYKVARMVTRNLDKVIDVTNAVLPEIEKGNLHRPIAIGVQGLADVFMKLSISFTCDRAKQLNRDIFETIYFAALTESCALAKELGVYGRYEGSPVSKGILQQDMWGVIPSDRWDWDILRQNISEFGVRNSLLTAPMPTASTSQILGNTEAFEAKTSNLYVRRTLSG